MKEILLLKKETPKTELPFDDDINHLQNSCVAELFDKSDQREFEILQYKNDTLPRGLTPLDDLFDFNDVAKKPKMESTETNVEECKIGGMKELKIIKLSKTLPSHKKHKYIELFREFKDVFAWGYEDLKSYDTKIIQHKIPLKENQKPFKQNLRRINPLLLPSVEKEIKNMYDAEIIVPI